MIEGRPLPLTRVVTKSTVLRKAGFVVLRICRAAELIEVAVDAFRRRPGKRPLDVALRAVGRGVGAGKLEAREVMVKTGVRPFRRGVTVRALRGEVTVGVVGVGRRTEIRLVAVKAVLRRTGEAAIRMAARARRLLVRAGEIERCLGGMVEGRAAPCRSEVAGLAFVRETRRGMVRLGGRGEVRGVAPETIRRRSRESAADVALIAADVRVRAGQRESRHLAVFEPSVLPLVHRVAGFALRREAPLNVVRLANAREVPLMAGDAFGAETRERAGRRARMALRALGRRMGAGQRETIQVVLDFLDGVGPTLHAVAVLATCAELVAVGVGVAVRALHANVGKNQRPVAVRTLHASMQPSKRVAGLRVVVKLRDSANRPPTGRGVAILAGEVERSVGVDRSRGLLRRCQDRRQPQ